MKIEPGEAQATRTQQMMQIPLIDWQVDESFLLRIRRRPENQLPPFAPIPRPENWNGMWTGILEVASRVGSFGLE
jgi:hypothetical protein